MPSPLPPKRFQIHLSTAIVLMFVAGGLIWTNVRGGIVKRVEDTIFIDHYYGWPFGDLIYSTTFDNTIQTYWIDYTKIALDLGVALLLLLAVYFLCERLIRRRAAGKRGEP